MNSSKVAITAIPVALLPASAYAQQTNFVNPLGSVRSVDTIIITLVNWLLGIAALLALLALVIGGIRLIFGGFNNEQEAAKGKRIVVWALIGLSVVIMSLVIIEVLSRTILKLP